MNESRCREQRREDDRSREAAGGSGFGVTDQTLYNWKSKYSGIEAIDSHFASMARIEPLQSSNTVGLAAASIINIRVPDELTVLSAATSPVVR